MIVGRTQSPAGSLGLSVTVMRVVPLTDVSLRSFSLQTLMESSLGCFGVGEVAGAVACRPVLSDGGPCSAWVGRVAGILNAQVESHSPTADRSASVAAGWPKSAGQSPARWTLLSVSLAGVGGTRDAFGGFSASPVPPG